METSAFLLAYFKDMLYIFGICPCCGEIFNLSDAKIRFNKSAPKLPKYGELISAQEQVEIEEENLSNLESRYHERSDALSFKEDEYRTNVEPEIIRKVRVEGRRQALSRIKKIDKVFTRKGRDPRDIRPLGSPVGFVSFNGMTESKEVKSIELINHKPKSSLEEKTIKSIEGSIKRGNIEFVLIRVSDKGAVSYDLNQRKK